ERVLVRGQLARVEPADLERRLQHRRREQGGLGRRSDALAGHRVDEAACVSNQHAPVEVVRAGGSVRPDDPADRRRAQLEARAPWMAAAEAFDKVKEEGWHVET